MTARTAPLLFAAALLGSATAHAQVSAPPAQGASTDVERVKQVVVYGDDPCPQSSSPDEIMVCARLPDSDRYRIPKELRTDPNNPALQSWAMRAESIEYVGRTGTESCSPVGAGGFTGCFEQMARAARAERRAMLGDASWADLVEQERRRRLSAIDADSEQIEERVKAEERARADADADAARAAQEPAADPGK